MEGMKAYQHVLTAPPERGAVARRLRGLTRTGQTSGNASWMFRECNSGCFRGCFCGCETPQALRASSPFRRSSLLASGFRSSSSMISGLCSNLASGFCFFLGVVLFWLLFPVRTMGQSVAPAQVDSLVKKVLAETRIDRERYKRVARKRSIDGVYRITTPEEVWKHYQAVGPDSLLPYEYYEVFEMEKDLAKKEALAQVALQSVKDEDGKRQWPLAAYELARCYLERGVVDTTLLLPYIDWQKNSDYHRIGMDDYGNESWGGWYNDAAIVRLQMMMYCKTGNYQMADSVGTYLLGEGCQRSCLLQNSEDGNLCIECSREIDKDEELLYMIRRFYKTEEECVNQRRYM